MRTFRGAERAVVQLRLRLLRVIIAYAQVSPARVRLLIDDSRYRFQAANVGETSSKCRLKVVSLCVYSIDDRRRY